MVLFLPSCIDEPEAPTLALEDTSQLAQVRGWFEANKTKLRIPSKGTNYRTESQELILPFFEKEPDWEQFHHYYFPDGREVFEVSLENENLYIPIAKEAGINEEDVDYFQNILFVKHPTLPKFDPLIIRYYPEENTSNRDFEAISYQMIDEKWSGWIDLFTYDEHYLMGYKVTEGELTHTREMQKNPENAHKIAVSSENKSDEAIHCYVVATDWYDGRTGEYLDTTHAQTCEWQRGGSTSSYGGYSGGSYGGGGGADGLGGTCSSCYDPPEVPEPTLRVEIDQSIKNNATLNCIVQKLQLAKFINDLTLFDGNSINRNVILKVGPTPKINGWEVNALTDGSLGPYRIEITLNEKKIDRGALDIARTIIHELIHAEIIRANDLAEGSSWDPDFQINYEKYRNNYGKDWPSHEYMAEHMVNKIANALMQIHPYLGLDEFRSNPEVLSVFPRNSIPSDFYKAMAWVGLDGTVEYNNNPSRDTYKKWHNDTVKKHPKPCN